METGTLRCLWVLEGGGGAGGARWTQTPGGAGGAGGGRRGERPRVCAGVRSCAPASVCVHARVCAGGCVSVYERAPTRAAARTRGDPRLWYHLSHRCGGPAGPPRIQVLGHPSEPHLEQGCGSGV